MLCTLQLQTVYSHWDCDCCLGSKDASLATSRARPHGEAAANVMKRRARAQVKLRRFILSTEALRLSDMLPGQTDITEECPALCVFVDCSAVRGLEVMAGSVSGD